MRKGAREGRVCIEEVGVSAVSEVCRYVMDFTKDRGGSGSALLAQWRWTAQRLRAEAGLFHAQQSIGRNVPIDRFKRLGGNNEMKGGADITQMQMP